MKKVMVILASLTMVVMISGSALAAGPGGKGKFQRPQLTQEQVEQINQARTKFLNDTLELRKKMATKRIDLKNLYMQPNPDKAKI